ncbi:RING-type E3 ubiquitin transferase [Trifolium repens]|nr:RING-type E3 ubiquitin transferase [Trifolium repens]
MVRERVNNAKLLTCFTCPLCNNIFRNATSISECLDIFCRECIERKLIDEKLNHCPVCKVDLGCSPLDKLKTDNNWKTIQDHLVTSEGKIMTAENVPSTPLVTKIRKNSQTYSKSNAKKAKTASKKIMKYVRKGKKIQEKPKQLQEELPITPQAPKAPASELSVVEDVKKDVKQQGGIEILDEVSTILSARRAKIAARKKFIRTELTPTAQPDKVTVDEKKDDMRPWLETVTETPKIRFKNSSKPESSSQKIVFKNVSRDNAESLKEKAVMCEPLNCLVETTKKNNSPNNSTMQENGIIPMLVDSSDNDSHHVTKFEVKNHCNNHQTELEDNQNDPKSSSLKFKLKRVEEKRVKFFEDLNLPALPENESKEDFGSFWFSLVASKEQELGALPQISSPYLRVKDGSLPVSHIKKYIVKKLNLANEAEVEILLEGKPVLCSMKLQNLMEMWLETMSKNERVETSVGSSAKDFVMVLSYRRKA